MKRLVEIRSYALKPGRAEAFHRTGRFLDALLWMSGEAIDDLRRMNPVAPE